MKTRVLVIDDEPRMAEIVAMVLRRDGLEVHAETESSKALDTHAADPFDLVLTDLRMPAPDGLEVLKRVHAQTPEVPLILFTAHATVANAIEALREGAFDYVQKPFDNDALRACVKRALAHTALARENRYLRAELRQKNGPDGIVATSPVMESVLDVVRRAARSDATVLVTGESGTGKELIARAVHFHSERVGRPFVAVNCKAFSEGVLESELFGHERGAFTGADRARAGLFEEADGGTLFLDEIGEVDGSFQAKLLRVLQEGELRRVGSDAARRVDVRVVAATNREFEREVAEGRFREDLFFRLAVIPIHIPPLRERREDILPLARHFLAQHAQDRRPRIDRLGKDVENLLEAHDWPGNVRELENAIERAVVLCEGLELQTSDLLLASTPPVPVASTAGAAARSLQECVDSATVEAIRDALEQTRGMKSDAARLLGIDRTTLYRLIRRFALDEDERGS